MNHSNEIFNKNTTNSIMRYFWPIVIAVAICYLVGYVSSLFQQEALVMWYPTLYKPAITPPDWVFPIAWSFIYLCMGVSIALVWYKPEKVFKHILKIFAIQLLLNFIWSFLFFTMHSPTLGFIDIIALDVAVILYIAGVYKIKKISAWLFAPYIIWLAFATYLNGYIVLAN